MEEIIFLLSILSKTIQSSNVISIKTPMILFTELNKTLKNLYGPTKDTSSQGNPGTKEQNGGIMLTDFKLYYTKLVIKTVWTWHK